MAPLWLGSICNLHTWWAARFEKSDFWMNSYLNVWNGGKSMLEKMHGIGRYNECWKKYLVLGKGGESICNLHTWWAATFEKSDLKF